MTGGTLATGSLATGALAAGVLATGVLAALPAGVTGLVRRASELTSENVSTGTDRVLQARAELRGLLPGRGLRRGATIAVRAEPGGATSLLFSLLAPPSQGGAWCAVAGLRTLGLAAAAEAGVALDRLVLVPDPGPDWAAVVAALVDGFDIVVAAGTLPPSARGRLAARARQRGCVLMPFGGAWDGADVTLAPVSQHWYGLGSGHGRLRSRELTVVVTDRSGRPQQAKLWMPGGPHPETRRSLHVLPPADGPGHTTASHIEPGHTTASHTAGSHTAVSRTEPGPGDWAGASSALCPDVRTMLVWCPDWPVIAAGIIDGVPGTSPVAVMDANRVIACSPAARAEGVRRGLRKRDAQARCPELIVVEHDPARDARAFEPVVAAIEELAAGVEVVRPGVCALAARGPAGVLRRRGTGRRAHRRADRHRMRRRGADRDRRRYVRGPARRAGRRHDRARAVRAAFLADAAGRPRSTGRR